MRQKYYCFGILLMLVVYLASCSKPINGEPYTGTVKIIFKNKVKDNDLVLNSQTYTNAFGEEYTVTKFKYYITNVSLTHENSMNYKEEESYHLIDAGNEASHTFSFEIYSGNYQKINFLIGVDSLRNVSGAQTGALDPLNDMFWTWNSGYIMAKLEGNSPASPAVNNTIEYHIGGFKGANNTIKEISISNPFTVQSGKTTAIIIEADVDTWWQNPHDLKFADAPVSTMPGELSKKYADNYSKMFTLKSITNL